MGTPLAAQAKRSGLRRRPAAKMQKAENAFGDMKLAIDRAIERDGIAILPPMDVLTSLTLVGEMGYEFSTVMLDPWYNKGFGGVQHDYMEFFLRVIKKSGELGQHIYFWGFPEIIAPFVERIPSPLILTCWLTWYYKNNPSVIRGWRSSQNACLHLSQEGAPLFPERFLNEKQRELQRKGKLRYMPGPTSVLEGATDVIEQPLLVGFVGRDEQTGHPSQKPLKVYDQLLQMTVPANGLVFDPMAGSGTTGAAARLRNFRAILCDSSDEYTQICESRLGVERIQLSDQLTAFLGEKK